MRYFDFYFSTYNHRLFAARKGENVLATVIGAGRYVFGEDIPMGKYDLRALSGNGMLAIQIGSEEDEEKWINFGIRDSFAKEYKNLVLRNGWYFSLDGDLQVEITKSKMLEIE